MGWARRILRGSMVAVLGAAPVVIVGMGSTPAGALTLSVTNNHDSGAGSLRAAIAASAADGGDDVITVQSGVGTITLASTIAWQQDGALVIHGNGVVIDANGHNGALHETSGGDGAMTLDNVTVANSHASGAAIDGAFVDEATGDLTLTNCSFHDNTSTGRPAGHSDSAAVVLIGSGALSVTGCSFMSNTSSGTSTVDTAGALDVEGGPLTLVNSNISDNHATAGANSVAGGGVDVEGGSTTIRNSSIVSNIVSLTGDGGDAAGGIVTEGGSIDLRNSTVAGNSGNGTGAADNAAGGVLSEGGAATLAYDTLAQNTPPKSDQAAAAQLRNDGGGLDSFGTVFTPKAGSAANCIQDGGASVSHGFNFSDDASCDLTGATDKHSGDALLGVLDDNGSVRGKTIAPHEGSPLIDAIPTAHCKDDGASGISTDQRGVARPQRSACDIGALEKAPVPPTTTTTEPVTTPTVSPTTVPELPRTGSTSGGLFVVAAGIAVLGLALVGASRRRRRSL